MKALALAQTTSSPSIKTAPSLFLQRRCACGAPAGLSGSCEDCADKQLLGSRLQAKLVVGSPDDPLESEAERIADKVVASPGHESVGRAPVRVQRLSGDASGQTTEVPTSVERVLSSPGRPLEPGLREEMEGRFGYDFSRVRVHTGEWAGQSARDVNAQAFTVGSEVVFGNGRYTPETSSGRRLIAHELTHVIQQSGDNGTRIRESTLIGGGDQPPPPLRTSSSHAMETVQRDVDEPEHRTAARRSDDV